MIREAGNMTEEEEQELKNVAAIGYAGKPHLQLSPLHDDQKPIIAGSDSVRFSRCSTWSYDWNTEKS